MRLGGIIIEPNKDCTAPWRLDEWTENLMGKEWTESFNEWADINLPRLPAIYQFGNKFVAHPIIIDELKKNNL